MSFADIVTIVEEYLETNWQKTPIRFANTQQDHAIPYIECYVKPGEIESLEIKGVGSRVGVIIINIFTEINVGVLQGADFAGELEELFWHKDLGGVVCDGDILPYSRDLGIERDAVAYQHQVVIPFYVITEV